MPAHCAEWSVEMPPASGPYSVPTSEVDVGVPALFGVVGFPPPHHHFSLGEPQGILEGFPGGSAIKKPPANAGDVGLGSGVGKITWRRKWQPTPVFLTGKSH